MATTTITVGPIGRDHTNITDALAAAPAPPDDALIIIDAGTYIEANRMLPGAKIIEFRTEGGIVEIGVDSGPSPGEIIDMNDTVAVWGEGFKFLEPPASVTRSVLVRGSSADVTFSNPEIVVRNTKTGLQHSAGNCRCNGILTTGGGVSSSTTRGISASGATFVGEDLRTRNSGQGIRLSGTSSLKTITRWHHVGTGGADDIGLYMGGAAAGTKVTASTAQNVRTGMYYHTTTTNRLTLENFTVDQCVNGLEFTTNRSAYLTNVLITNYSNKAITRAASTSDPERPVKLGISGTFAADLENYLAPLVGLESALPNYVDPDNVDPALRNMRPQDPTVAAFGDAPTESTEDLYSDLWTDPAPIGAANAAEDDAKFEVTPGLSEINNQRFFAGATVAPGLIAEDKQIIRRLIAQHNSARAMAGPPLVNVVYDNEGAVSDAGSHIAGRRHCVALRMVAWTQIIHPAESPGITVYDSAGLAVASWVLPAGRYDNTVELATYPTYSTVPWRYEVQWPTASRNCLIIGTITAQAAVSDAMSEPEYLQFARAALNQPLDVHTMRCMLGFSGDLAHPSRTDGTMYSRLWPSGWTRDTGDTIERNLAVGPTDDLWLSVLVGKPATAGNVLSINGHEIGDDWALDTTGLYRVEWDFGDSTPVIRSAMDGVTMYALSIYRHQEGAI